MPEQSVDVEKAKEALHTKMHEERIKKGTIKAGEIERDIHELGTRVKTALKTSKSASDLADVVSGWSKTLTAENNRPRQENLRIILPAIKYAKALISTHQNRTETAAE